MKDSKNEKLSQHLLNMDDSLIEKAYNVGDAEKLRRYVRYKKRKSSYFAKIPVIEAVFLLDLV